MLLSQCDPVELRNRLISGVSITEFAALLNKSFAGATTTADRLEKNGYVIKQPTIDSRTHRKIIRITLINVETSPQELFELAYPGKRARNNNFVAPDLSPRIKQVVDLRLAGLSEEEIAKQTGLSKHTVGLYLTYARHPEKLMRYRRKSERDISPLIDRVNKLLERDGYVISNESEIPHFGEVYKYFNQTELAHCVLFLNNRNFFGNLANCKAIYSDKAKFAEYVARRIYKDVFSDFRGFSRYSGGITKSFRGFNYKLTEVFVADKLLPSAVWSRLKELGVHLDEKLNIQTGQKEKEIALSDEEISRLKAIMSNIHTAVSASGYVYNNCKVFTNFFERLARKYHFEPSKVSVDRTSWKIRRIVE